MKVKCSNCDHPNRKNIKSDDNSLIVDNLGFIIASEKGDINIICINKEYRAKVNYSNRTYQSYNALVLTP